MSDVYSSDAPQVYRNSTAMDSSGLFMSSATQFGYVPNDGNNTISICPIEGDGSLGTCTTSAAGGTFNHPSAVFLAAQP
jgi:hypothetical protein